MRRLGRRSSPAATTFEEGFRNGSVQDTAPCDSIHWPWGFRSCRRAVPAGNTLARSVLPCANGLRILLRHLPADPHRPVGARLQGWTGVRLCCGRWPRLLVMGLSLRVLAPLRGWFAAAAAGVARNEERESQSAQGPSQLATVPFPLALCDTRRPLAR